MTVRNREEQHEFEQEFDDLDEELLYGEKTIRWYQFVALRMTEKAFTQDGARRVCVSLPTGAGKTLSSGIIFNSPILRSWLGLSNETDNNGVYKEKLRILFLAHKHRLLTQAERTFEHDNGVETFYQSIFSNIPDALLKDGWHITVCDEAHHEAMASFQHQLDNYTNSVKSVVGFIPMIGLTATYQRADGMLIKFDKIIEPITREEAVAEGWLAPTNIYSFVDSTRGNNKEQIIKDMVKDYNHLMGRTMVFVRTREEVAELTRFINEVVKRKAVGVLHQSEQELNTILDRMADGDVEFVVNCNKIGEGVDVPVCDSVILGRTIGSYPLLNQIIGRAARPGTDCNVFELVNPLSSRNLDTTVVTGTPNLHKLIFKKGGQWQERVFDYVSSGFEDANLAHF